MRIAITGGTGFIGRRLAQALKGAGHTPVIIDTDPSADEQVDIMDRQELANAFVDCEAVYHLAAAHRDDIFPRSVYYEINGTGTKNVLDAATANGITRVIFTSTFAVYALDSTTPDEDTPPSPFNDYGKSKLDAETHLKLWAKANPDRSVTIIRPVVVFGEGNRGNVHTLIRQIASGKFLMIGSGHNRKSMAYVGNVAAFLKHSLGFGPGLHLYNYADKPDMDMEELTDLICKKLGKKKPPLRLPYMLGLGAGYACDGLARISGRNLPVSAVRVRKFCADTTCSAERIRETGFVPECSLEDGLDRMIAHDFVADAGQKAA